MLLSWRLAWVQLPDAFASVRYLCMSSIALSEERRLRYLFRRASLEVIVIADRLLLRGLVTAQDRVHNHKRWRLCSLQALTCSAQCKPNLDLRRGCRT